ncbi:hypothetical protein B484DRAFT_453891 [Ochromonadaceae sp. CCMP2298]|nr:hypothetical protein B484DRAFT_453891 [Ochromonadaceae sp. CCMP2298]
MDSPASKTPNRDSSGSTHSSNASSPSFCRSIKSTIETPATRLKDTMRLNMSAQSDRSEVDGMHLTFRDVKSAKRVYTPSKNFDFHDISPPVHPFHARMLQIPFSSSSGEFTAEGTGKGVCGFTAEGTGEGVGGGAGEDTVEGTVEGMVEGIVEGVFERVNVLDVFESGATATHSPSKVRAVEVTLFDKQDKMPVAVSMPACAAAKDTPQQEQKQQAHSKPLRREVLQRRQTGWQMALAGLLVLASFAALFLCTPPAPLPLSPLPLSLSQIVRVRLTGQAPVDVGGQSQKVSLVPHRAKGSKLWGVRQAAEHAVTLKSRAAGALQRAVQFLHKNHIYNHWDRYNGHEGACPALRGI